MSKLFWMIMSLLFLLALLFAVFVCLSFLCVALE